ncbi:DUF2515 family protein [Pseudomonas sp. UBA2684]|uniref:DUF2515 family protein n=1 Tax=Pseudomonas sp. UBA2684 TaxID=1947311 RepID=UPI000E83552B|nr:hypothetical protein [Pseudomonas sp. UBA2684]HBX53920.1 hypothetical protein [Pseudomonas sp.]|tara:strand:+ start:544 stop:1554 length:1011 start_codon:yes stop_codon:yes gene_type:complete
MSTAPITTFATNAVTRSVCEEPLACDKLWAMGQEAAISRLSVETRSFFSTTAKQELVADFSARAARIAATYARFYLEQEEDGKPHLKGRFYWMGLAAFASKQVKCGLDFIPSEPYLTLATPPIAQPPLRIGKNALGKGNFWLFQDIFVWHWFYSKYPEQFEECAPERNARDCVPQVQLNIDSLPWAAEALATINNLQVTAEIKKAFKLIQTLEGMPDGPSKRTVQLESLMDIADHEQRKILQPLIYEDYAFKLVLNAQALAEGLPFVPLRVAALSTACDIENPKLRVQMTEGNLYDVDDRMTFITKIAMQYHKMMGEQKEYMEGAISTITSWRNSA